MDNNIDFGKMIADQAKLWLNTPFEHHASVFGKGCDCIGLVIGVLKNTGLLKEDFQVEYYSREFMLHHSEEILLTRLRAYSNPVEQINLVAGDFLLFQFGRCVSHVGIYLSDNLFIHSETKKGVSYAILKNSEWSKRYREGLRLNYLRCPISGEK
jgi:cell wall-associated NlpC family hydrolase